MRAGINMLKSLLVCTGGGFLAHHLSPVIRRRWPAYGWQLMGKFGVGAIIILVAQRYLLHQANVEKCAADKATILGLCGAVSVGLGVLAGHFLYPDELE